MTLEAKLRKLIHRWLRHAKRLEKEGREQSALTLRGAVKELSDIIQK